MNAVDLLIVISALDEEATRLEDVNELQLATSLRNVGRGIMGAMHRRLV